MKQFSKKILLLSFIIFSAYLFLPATGQADHPLNFTEEARQPVLMLVKVEPGIDIGAVENIQEEMVEIVHQKGQVLFEQMDQLARVQGELGKLIRDQASLKFQTAQEIEAIRSDLELMMGENTFFQIEVSQQIGKGQEEIGKAILAAQRAPQGTQTYRRAQERLGQMIRDNAILHNKIGITIAARQERMGTVIRDHARFLLLTSEQIGQGEEKLAQIILEQAQMLQSANNAMIKDQKGLGMAIRDGARSERALLAQFGMPE